MQVACRYNNAAAHDVVTVDAIVYGINVVGIGCRNRYGILGYGAYPVIIIIHRVDGNIEILSRGLHRGRVNPSDGRNGFTVHPRFARQNYQQAGRHIGIDNDGRRHTHVVSPARCGATTPVLPAADPGSAASDGTSTWSLVAADG